MPFSKFKNFKDLKKEIDLIEDMTSGRHGSTFISKTDDSFLIKQYKDKKAIVHLKELIEVYNQCMENVQNSNITNDLELVPFLYVGEDFIVKKFMMLMTPFNELKSDSSYYDEYLEIIKKIEKSNLDSNTKELILNNIKRPTSYYAPKEEKIYMCDLNF